MRDTHTNDLHASDRLEPLPLRANFAGRTSGKEDRFPQHFNRPQARSNARGTAYFVTEATVFSIAASNDRTADPTALLLKRQGLGVTGSAAVADAMAGGAKQSWTTALFGLLSALSRGLSSDDAEQPRPSCS